MRRAGLSFGKHCLRSLQQRYMQSQNLGVVSVQPVDEAAGSPMNVKITMIGGETHNFETRLSAKVSDVKIMIQKQLGHAPWSQNLIFGTTALVDSDAILKDVGVAEGSTLTLLLKPQVVAMGQSSLTEASGKKTSVDHAGARFWKPMQALSEFEFKSWLVACAADQANGGIWDIDPTSDSWQAACEAEADQFNVEVMWGNVGCGGVDFYWTTAADGCRFEYWSTAPGDNEYGILVRVDADTMTAIGEGSDDGIMLYAPFNEQFKEDAAVQQILKSGWPRFDGSDEEQEEVEEDEEEEDE